MSTFEPTSQFARPSALHDAGQGSALVLLHGLGGNWEVWRPVLAALERQHRVIALTLPGHSGGPAYAGQGDASVAGLADQVIAMLQSLGIARAHVAGNSLGGWLSLELARRGFALSVVAFSPAGGWRSDADYRAIAGPFRIVHALAGVLAFLASALAGFGWFRRLLMKQTLEHGERLSPAEFVGGLRAMARTPVLPGLLRTMGRDGPAAPLPSPNVPVTIAWGECDRVIPYARYGAPFRERIAGLDERVVAGAGHVPMWDNPAQVASHILDVTGAADGLPSEPRAMEVGA